VLEKSLNKCHAYFSGLLEPALGEASSGYCSTVAVIGAIGCRWQWTALGTLDTNHRACSDWSLSSPSENCGPRSILWLTRHAVELRGDYWSTSATRTNGCCGVQWFCPHCATKLADLL